jgi:hypothetical protein
MSIFLQTSVTEKDQLLRGVYEFYCTSIFQSKVVEVNVMVFDILLPTLISFDTLPQAKLYVIWGNIIVIHTQKNLINLKNINSYIYTVILLKVHKLIKVQVVSDGLFFSAHNMICKTKRTQNPTFFDTHPTEQTAEYLLAFSVATFSASDARRHHNYLNIPDKSSANVTKY